MPSFNRRNEPLFKSFTATTASGSALLVGLVLSLDDTVELRLINNSAVVFYAGQEYTNTPFEFSFAADAPPALPKASIEISNIPAHISSLLERYKNKDVGCRVQQFLHSPESTVIIYETEMSNTRVRVSEGSVSIELGYTNVLGRPYTVYYYGQGIAPGLLP